MCLLYYEFVKLNNTKEVFNVKNIILNNHLSDEYNALSNHSNHPFTLGGYEWPTVTHYIEAQKFVGTARFEEIRLMVTPEEAEKAGENLELANENTVTRAALIAKLYTYPEILALLLDTNGRAIQDAADPIWNKLGFYWTMIRNEFQNILILESEKEPSNVAAVDYIERHKVIEELRGLPADAFSKLRHLQPEVGCFNRCSFCSQSAGTRIWSLNLNGLQNIFSALKTVAMEKAQQFRTQEGDYYLDPTGPLTLNQRFHPYFEMPKHGLLGYGRLSHRPGVIFPYLDNDISTYPFLKQYIQYAAEDLGVKVRLSTVGYSRHNTQLQNMHDQINEHHLNHVAGVRLSITSYTYGWKNKATRDSFKEDVANVLATYKPLIDHLKPGQRTGCVEFRFKPLLEDRLVFRELFDANDHHVMAVGPYALMSTERAAPFTKSYIHVDEANQMHVDGKGQSYLMIQSGKLRDVATDELSMTVEMLLTEAHAMSRFVQVYLFENEDGVYYGVDPMMQNNGMFAKQFYPPTAKRPSAGYIDSERYFLNTLLSYKRQKGILDRRGTFEAATWTDVANTVHLLMHAAEELAPSNQYAANYVQAEIIPLIQLYAEALLTAGYAPSYFFLSTFTVDTGSICNLGKAYNEFKHLASRPHIPLTPQQEKSFGLQGALSMEGEKWRISVAPYSHQVLRDTSIGKRNLLADKGSLLIERENLALRSVGGANGMADIRQHVSFSHIDIFNVSDGEERIIGGK